MEKRIKKVLFYIVLSIVMVIIISVCSILHLDYKIAAFLGGGVGALICILNRESKNR